LSCSVTRGGVSPRLARRIGFTVQFHTVRTKCVDPCRAWGWCGVGPSRPPPTARVVLSEVCPRLTVCDAPHRPRARSAIGTVGVGPELMIEPLGSWTTTGGTPSALD
jgi:hypothetical protein